MAEKNPYYIDKEDTKKLTIEQIKAAKYNNVFLISLFTNIVDQEGFNASTAAGKHRAQINLGELPCSEKTTGLPQYELGKKLEFLIGSLTNSPDARSRFMSSYFRTLIDRIRDGSVGDNKSWVDYSRLSSCDRDVEGYSPLNAALLAYSKDDSCEIGLNFAKLIDCLVRKNRFGKFEFVNFNETTSENKEMSKKMGLAINEQLLSLKTNNKFTRNFKYDPSNEAFI